MSSEQFNILQTRLLEILNTNPHTITISYSTLLDISCNTYLEVDFIKQTISGVPAINYELDDNLSYGTFIVKYKLS